MNRGIKVTLAATTALGLAIAALASDSPSVTTLTAGAAPAAPAVSSPADTRPLLRQYLGKEVKREEITKPGSVSVYAVWFNGKIWRVTVPYRRYVVTYADGTTGEHVTEDSSAQASQLPPYDPKLHRPPTAEEQAEMDRIANGRP